MSHPTELELAAYLDMQPNAPGYTELRAHILTCSVCTQHITRLRRDPQRIRDTLNVRAAPDIRATLKTRLPSRRPLVWLGQVIGLGAICAAILVFAFVLNERSGATAGTMSGTLFVIDREQGQLVALNAADGKRRGSVRIEDRPNQILYDTRRERLYVRTTVAIIALDPATLAVQARWDAPAPLNDSSGMALDEAHARLYVARPGGITALALDTPTLTEVRAYATGPKPGPIALARDGQTLYALDDDEATFWSINLASGAGYAQLLDRNDIRRNAWLGLSPDGKQAFVLRVGRANEQPVLSRIDLKRNIPEASAAIVAAPAPRDLLVVNDQLLAIARGDGRIGGVTLLDTQTFSTTAELDPSYDEHHLAAGPSGTLFALNWLHGTVTRYTLENNVVVWRTPQEEWQPWRAVFVVES